MADILSQMELCPYCKKRFKRLKSHLPYCKKVRPILPFNSDITHPKAVLFQLPKPKELQKEPTKAYGEETHKKSQSKRRNTNFIKAGLHCADLEMRTNEQTSEDMKNQIKITPQMTQNPTKSKRIVFLAENGHMLSAAKKYSKAKFTKYLPKLGEDKSKIPSEICGSPSKQSSIDEDKKHISSLLNDFRIEHAGQKLLTETLDLPFSICESFPSRDRSQNPYATLQSNERGPKARDPISEALHTVNNSETQRRITGSFFSANHINSSLYKTLQTRGMENHQTIKHRAKKKEFHLGLEAAGKKKEFHLGLEAAGKKKEFHLGLEAAGKGSWNKGFEGNKSPEVEMSTSDYVRDGPRKEINNDLAAEKTPHHDKTDSPLLPLGKLAYEEALSLADLGNQSLSTLVLKFLQEEEDGHKALITLANPMENKKSVSSEPDPEPKTRATHTDCQQQQPLNPSWHCAPKNLTSGHVEATGRKNLPTSLGLEWFPELYPGYLHLGVLPGRPQKGNIELQKPHHNFPEEEGFLKERSLKDVKIGKLPSWLTISNFSLMGLLGKVQKAWIKYPKYISLKKGSVGGITMLFAGYWVLCYSWSFKHLKLQRWRKHH